MMGAKYQADVTVKLTVFFEDDGKTSLVDQAYDAIWGREVSRYTDDVDIHHGSIQAVKVRA